MCLGNPTERDSIPQRWGINISIVIYKKINGTGFVRFIFDSKKNSDYC